MLESDVHGLYRKLLLDHARHPRNFRIPDQQTHSAEKINAVCGDHVCVYVSVQDSQIMDTAFTGTGCAICLASASMLTEDVIGLSVSTALQRTADVQELIAAKNDSGIGLGKLEALRGVRRYPSRVQCATLAWRALQDAIHTE